MVTAPSLTRHLPVALGHPIRERELPGQTDVSGTKTDGNTLSKWVAKGKAIRGGGRRCQTSVEIIP